MSIVDQSLWFVMKEGLKSNTARSLLTKPNFVVVSGVAFRRPFPTSFPFPRFPFLELVCHFRIPTFSATFACGLSCTKLQYQCSQSCTKDLPIRT